MSQLRGSSATRSPKEPDVMRSMIAQMPQACGAPATSCGAIDGLFFHLHEFDARVLEQFVNGLQLVGLVVIDRADAGVDQYLHAMDTRSVSDVNVGVADRAAIFGGLRNRVHLGVDSAIAVLLDITVGRARLIDEAAHVGAVRQARWRSVIAGCEDAAVAQDDGADFRTQAGRSLGHLARDRHEILVPAWTIHRRHDLKISPRVTAASGLAAGSRSITLIPGDCVGPCCSCCGCDSLGAGGTNETGTGLKVSKNSATVAQAIMRRLPASGVCASMVEGWPRPRKNTRTNQISQP